MYWEAYGPFAIGQFDSIGFNQSAKYSFEIQKKNYNTSKLDIFGYTQPIINCLCAGNPAVLRYLNDDIIGIKGAECILTLINKDGQLPLTTFYSEEEDTFKLVLKVTYVESNVQVTKTLFEGYLIQEDSNEILTDITHEIQLSFTDNLGALKNLDFYQASMVSPTSAANLVLSIGNMELLAESNTLSPYVNLYTNSAGVTFNNGDFIFLNDSPSGDVAYKIIGVLGNALFIDIPPIPFGLTSSVRFAKIVGSDVYGRIKLADALRICLHGTNMNLDIVYAGNLVCLTNDTNTNIFDTIYIDGKTFLQDRNNWLSCYDVLDKICKTFNISLFQQDGKWHLIRVHEYIIYSGVIPGITFNGYFVQQSTGNITSLLNFGNGSDIEAGIEQTIQRPYNFNIKQFDYKVNNNLLYNALGSITGLKIRQYNDTLDGQSVVVYEYEWDGWINFNTFTDNIYQPFIRIIKDLFDQELERYTAIRYLSGSSPTINSQGIVKSKSFECKKGDKLKITFDFKSTSTQTFRNYTFKFRLYKGNAGTDFAYLRNDGAWIIGQPNIFIYTSDGNGTTEWLTINIESKEMPFDGIFDMNLSEISENGGETYYRNIQVEYVPFVSKLNIAQGHQHKTSINKMSKNNINEEVFIDDSQKNAVSGTLFLNSFTNLVQNRTSIWLIKSSNQVWPNIQVRLGQITTREIGFWKFKPRPKLECNILGIIKSDDSRFKMFNGLFFTVNNKSIFIFGKAEFNFKEDTIKATLFEMYNLDDSFYGFTLGNLYVATDKVNYEFKYLYK